MFGLKHEHLTMSAFGQPIDKRIVSLYDVLVDILSRMIDYACPY